MGCMNLTKRIESLSHFMSNLPNLILVGISQRELKGSQAQSIQLISMAGISQRELKVHEEAMWAMEHATRNLTKRIES